MKTIYENSKNSIPKTMIYVLFLFTTLISTFGISAKEISKTNDISIEYSPMSKAIIMNGNDCKELTRQAINIKKWSDKIGESPSQVEKCECNNNYCKLPITDIVPTSVRDYYKAKPFKPGPNCWNGALVSNKILSYFRNSTSDEMSFWMNSPLCEEKNTDSKLMPGDIIAIRSNSGEEHGFVYISDKLSFSKNGVSARKTYKIQSTKQVFDLYEVENKCEHVYGKSNSCKNWANVYKCKTWNQYKAELKSNRKNFKLNYTNMLDDIERKISDLVFKAEYMNSDLSILDDELASIYDYVNQNIENIYTKKIFGIIKIKKKNKEKLTKEDKLFWGIMKNKIQSLRHQIQIISES